LTTSRRKYSFFQQIIIKAFNQRIWWAMNFGMYRSLASFNAIIAEIAKTKDKFRDSKIVIPGYFWIEDFRYLTIQ